MSLFADALQPLLLLGIVKAKRKQPTDVTLGGLISAKGQGCYATRHQPAWTLDFGQPGKLSPFFASGCARFATAAFQSFVDIRRADTDPNHLPWALVTAYYGAFYAGHSMLRAIGSTCTYVKDDDLSRLREVFTLYGVTEVFPAGLCSTRSDPAERVLTLESLGTKHGGSHEAFWKFFSHRLTDIGNSTLNGPLPSADSQSVWALLEALRGVLSRDGGRGCWLSVIRNDIQYQHKHGAWYSCRVAAKDRRAISRVAMEWRSDPFTFKSDLANPNDLVAFMTACTFLVAACHSIVTRLESMADGPSAASWMGGGPLKFSRLSRSRS